MSFYLASRTKVIILTHSAPASVSVCIILQTQSAHMYNLLPPPLRDHHCSSEKDFETELLYVHGCNTNSILYSPYITVSTQHRLFGNENIANNLSQQLF